MSDKDETGGMLSRWSKRKIAVTQEQVPEGGEEPVAEIVGPEEEATQKAELEAQLEANRLAAEAVDLETLNEESDFSVFMKEGVPQILKKQAMASLWRTSPIFANVDGLVDYDDDFGSPDLVMKTFKSAYQAGRGYLDLFNETNEPKSGDDAEAEIAEGAQNEAVVDTEEEPSEMATIKDVDGGQVVAPDDEPELDEDELATRVSLRKRLELDTTG